MIFIRTFQEEKIEHSPAPLMGKSCKIDNIVFCLCSSGRSMLPAFRVGHHFSRRLMISDIVYRPGKIFIFHSKNIWKIKISIH